MHYLRNVQVNIEYAVVPNSKDTHVEPTNGMIRVVDKRKNENIICERPTKRTAEQKVEID